MYALGLFRAQITSHYKQKGDGVGKNKHSDLIEKEVVQFQKKKNQRYSLHVTMIVP